MNTTPTPRLPRVLDGDRLPRTRLALDIVPTSATRAKVLLDAPASAGTLVTDGKATFRLATRTSPASTRIVDGALVTDHAATAELYAPDVVHIAVRTDAIDAYEVGDAIEVDRLDGTHGFVPTRVSRILAREIRVLARDVAINASVYEATEVAA